MSTELARNKMTVEDIRYERKADIHFAFLTLGRAIICFRHL